MINLTPEQLAAMISERPYRITVDGVVTRYASAERAQQQWDMIMSHSALVARVKVTRNWM